MIVNETAPVVSNKPTVSVKKNQTEKVKEIRLNANNWTLTCATEREMPVVPDTLWSDSKMIGYKNLIAKHNTAEKNKCNKYNSTKPITGIRLPSEVH